MGKCLLKEVGEYEDGVSNTNVMSRELVPQYFANNPITHTLFRAGMWNTFGHNLMKASSDP